MQQTLSKFGTRFICVKEQVSYKDNITFEGLKNSYLTDCMFKRDIYSNLPCLSEVVSNHPVELAMQTCPVSATWI